MSNLQYVSGEAVENSMLGALGIEFLPTEGEIYRGRMPVNEVTRQPFGVLCGGATLAFAEILAGYGSFHLCAEGELPVGSQVSGSHVSSVKVAPGVFVEGYATCIHKGRRTHLWNVDVKTAEGRLVSSVRVTNFIVQDKFSE